MDKIIKVVEEAEKAHPDADEEDWLRLWEEIRCRAIEQVTSYRELMQIRACLTDSEGMVDPDTDPPATKKKPARKKNG
jgi:hypothetical protein